MPSPRRRWLGLWGWYDEGMRRATIGRLFIVVWVGVGGAILGVHALLRAIALGKPSDWLSAAMGLSIAVLVAIMSAKWNWRDRH